MYVAYAFIAVCVSDWLLKLPRLISFFNPLDILDYVAYVVRLWQSNAIATTAVLLVCSLGVPRLISSVRKTLKVVGRVCKSMLRSAIIIHVPIYVYLSIGSLKFYLLARNFVEPSISSIDRRPPAVSYWKEVGQSMALYRYSSMITITLFMLGLYTSLTHRWTLRTSKRLLSFLSDQLSSIRAILSTTVPTPLSLLLLLLLHSIVHLSPTIGSGLYALLTHRSLVWFTLASGGAYLLYVRLSAPSKLDLDFSGDVYLNDVSRLNSTRIFSLFYPRTINDVQYLISQAKAQGKTISIRGQAHTMGGQTLPSQKDPKRNYVCDLKYMNRVEYDEPTQEALVEAGATWTHVIKKLNAYGRSPVIMQSYCTFSVAGTISVNAHGITSDDAMYESVVSIEYIDVHGQRGQCSRDEQPELFSLMIGGYGLFGIITRLRLKTVSNVKTALEYIRLQSDQFATYYEEFLNDASIEIKIARVDLIHPTNILMFIFRQQLGTYGTIADLSDEARVMHPRQHLIYTYLAQRHPFRRIRFALEKVLARPLDLVFSTDRNTTMYESAKPMALLYQPLAFYDDTFVLQEYFIPKASFAAWYNRLMPILRTRYEHVFLLNLTIRFVKKDTLTFLAYTKENDCYAFVFYFRIQRNEAGDREVRDIHQRLIHLAFECQGTFYLPYRQHYSREQIARAYPMLDDFFAKKLSYDARGLFSNDWYERYRSSHGKPMEADLSHPTALITEEFQRVEQRRADSFYRVINDEILREKFRKFLRTVFDAEPVHVIFNYVNRAVRNPANKNDNDVYRDVQKSLATRQFASIRGLFALVKQVRQLRLQTDDMLRQQITIFKHLGYCGKIKDIVSIGDGGRCISELRQVLRIKDGRVFLLNDRQRLTDIVERRSLLPIGTFIPFNFTTVTDVAIPSESIDLIVCYMGLHHFPQDQLAPFLKMIHRILRPNGLFLFREHHAYDELKPLLDVAHMVFNVVTGVDYEAEVNEIRAFRTVEQWRSCLRQAGFEDTFIYDEQEDDPTDDIMIVVRKPIHDTATLEHSQTVSAGSETNYFRPCEWLIVRVTMQFGQYLNHTPFYEFPFVQFLAIYWSLCATETALAVRHCGLKTAVLASPGFLMNVFVGSFLSIAFLQLAFFSFLIRTVGGFKLAPEYEQLLLENPDGNEFDFRQGIDPRIDRIDKVQGKNVYAIRVPRHHVFTSIVKKLALSSARFNLLSVSGQKDGLQMEFIIHNNDASRLLWLKQRAHLDVIFEYTNPIDASQTHVIVRVKIGHLFPLLRDCAPFEDDRSLSIVQIFDHFD